MSEITVKFDKEAPESVQQMLKFFYTDNCNNIVKHVDTIGTQSKRIARNHQKLTLSLGF